MFILIKTVKNCTKAILRVTVLIGISIILFYGIFFTKFKPVYKVTLLGEEIGYITNKEEFEKLIEENIINQKDSNIAYVEVAAMPEYEYVLEEVDETNEQEIFNKVKDLATITYKVYGITVNGELAAYVESKDEAEEAVEKIKNENKSQLEKIDIVVKEEYTTNKEIVNSEVEIASAEKIVKEKAVEQAKILNSTLDGVYFKVKPVQGIITSRYGAYDTALRNHAHTGLDIGASAGTTIVAAADGKVTYSGWYGGYGNLVIIDHGNGIQTYYGHCSKLYATVGQEVKAGDKIAAVGRTGNADGDHLHFEIRKNGSTINPQRYTYN